MTTFAEADARRDAKQAEFRARAARDHAMRNAVAAAAGPGLLDMIENGQRLNDPRGSLYSDLGKDHVWSLVRIIEDYKYIQEPYSPEYHRAAAALACGHGYNLTDSCPGCDNDLPPNPDCLPLIALVRVPAEDDES
jgi:hypothetical protein